MSQLKQFFYNLKDNLAEYYTLLIIVGALPACIAYMTESVVFGLLVSFFIQSVIGILYIRGTNK